MIQAATRLTHKLAWIISSPIHKHVFEANKAIQGYHQHKWQPFHCYLFILMKIIPKDFFLLENTIVLEKREAAPFQG